MHALVMFRIKALHVCEQEPFEYVSKIEVSPDQCAAVYSF